MLQVHLLQNNVQHPWADILEVDGSSITEYWREFWAWAGIPDRDWNSGTRRELRNWAGIPELGGNSGTGWEFRNWTGILDLLQGLLKGGSFLVLACMESSKATQISLGLVGRPVYTGNDIPRFSSDGPSAWQMTLQNTSRTSRVYGGWHY